MKLRSKRNMADRIKMIVIILATFLSFIFFLISSVIAFLFGKTIREAYSRS